VLFSSKDFNPITQKEVLLAKTRIQLDADKELLDLFEKLGASFGCPSRVDTFRELVHKMAAIEELARDGRKLTVQIIHRTLVITTQPDS
jgi:hypothetical protein